jgi:Zn-dependent protease
VRSSLSLGKIFDIPIRLHFTWFFVFVLITASLIALPIPGTYVLWYRIIAGIIGSLLLFISIITHELAHSIVATKNKIPVKDITLFVFGGVSRITKEASRPTTEMLIAVVGPLTSILIAGIFHGIYLLLSSADISELITTIVRWLAFINALMAMFNLIPGFPLDGGRVFRSVIWLRTGNYIHATRIATTSGRIIGYTFIAGGIVVMFVTGEWMSGLWLAFVGWFLETSATISYREVLLRNAIYGLSAKEVMTSDYPVVSNTLNLSQLVQDYMLSKGHHSFIVAADGKLKGIITLKNIKVIPKDQWSTTSVEDIMIPSDKLTVAHPDNEVLSLFERMEEGNIQQVPVVENGIVIGLITRKNLLNLPRIRSQSLIFSVLPINAIVRQILSPHSISSFTGSHIYVNSKNICHLSSACPNKFKQDSCSTF